MRSFEKMIEVLTPFLFYSQNRSCISNKEERKLNYDHVLNVVCVCNTPRCQEWITDKGKKVLQTTILFFLTFALLDLL